LTKEYNEKELTFFLFLRFVVERETQTSLLDFKNRGISFKSSNLITIEIKLSIKQCQRVLEIVHNKDQKAVETALARLKKQVISPKNPND